MNLLLAYFVYTIYNTEFKYKTINIIKRMTFPEDLGRNHIHLTVRLGFVTQHLWLGDFGKCNRGLRAQILRLRYPKSSVTSPLS